MGACVSSVKQKGDVQPKTRRDVNAPKTTVTVVSDGGVSANHSELTPAHK